MSKFLVTLKKFRAFDLPRLQNIVLRQYCKSVYYDFDKKCAEPQCNIKNRHVRCLRSLTGDEIISLLETAYDLKKVATSTNKFLVDKNINIVVDQSCFINLISAIQGGTDLGAKVVTIYSTGLCSEHRSPRDLKELGKIISEHFNLICISSSDQYVISGISSGSSVPIINIGSCFYSPIDAVALALTLFEEFGKLKGLTVGIIGSPSPYVNSLLCALPRIGINVRILCMHCNEKVSSRYLELTKKVSKEFGTSVTEGSTVHEVIRDVDLVVLANDENMKDKLSQQDFFKVSKNWKISCKIPGNPPIDKELLKHDNNITYKVMTNLKVAYSAMYLRLLGINFEHVVKII